MRSHAWRLVVLPALALCATCAAQDAAGQTTRLADRDAFMQSPAGLSCRKTPSVDCLSDIAFKIASAEIDFSDPSLTARYLAEAGRFDAAYALAKRGSGPRAAEMLFRIALQELLQAAWAHLDKAADLRPLEVASAASADPTRTMLTGLGMVANELTGASNDVSVDSALLLPDGQDVVPRPAVPRATVDAILARWRELRPGSLGPVSVLLALGDRQSAIKETARLVADQKMRPHNVSSAWAEVGEAGRMSAIEETLTPPRATEFLETAEAMSRFGQPAEAVTRMLRRALSLLTDPVHDADHGLSPRRLIDGIAGSAGRDAALDAAGNAAERARLAGRRMPFLLAGIAAAYLDLADPVKARPLLREAVAALHSNDRTPSYIVILLYRLGDHAGFEAAMAAFGDDRDPRNPASIIRGEVWTSLLREKDVDPKLTFVTRAAVGEFAGMKPEMLRALAMRRMQQGRQAAIPQLIRAIAEAEEDILADNSYDLYKTSAFATLTAAAQIGRAVHDDQGTAKLLQVMVDASFSSGLRASSQLARVASFWHRRLPARP